MRRFPLVLAATLAAVVLAACGSAATPAPAASEPAASEPATGDACAVADASAATVNVTIADFAYDPEPVEADVGDVIAWSNTDSAPHTATPDAGGCSTGRIAPDGSGAIVFNVPGTYTYHCDVHPGQMKDYTINVSG